MSETLSSTPGSQPQGTAQASGDADASSAPSPHDHPITITNYSHHYNHPDSKPTMKPPAKKPTGPKKAAAVLTAAEIDRMIDLGLGRGLDSTNAKPWANKSAFQVRRVTAESVIGTEEGGSLQSYEREVTSVLSQQTDLKTSLVVPQSPVQIGIDAEQSRSVSSTRRTVGKKVVNRSLSFRSDFSDAPTIWNTAGADLAIRSYNARLDGTVADERVSPADERSVADVVGDDYKTFQERLSKWIVKRILQRQELTAQEMRGTGRPVGNPKFIVDDENSLAVLADFIYIADEAEKKKIIHDCYDFVKHFRITHYVSTIELGATEYRVFSETDYNSTIGVGGSLAVEKLANLSVTHKRTSRKLKKASDIKTIGKISEDRKVGRGTHDEAVVGIRVEPIYSLVKLPYLQLSLQRALIHYMDEQGDSSSGPFIIAFGSERSLRFWSVSDDYTVGATSNPQNASLFFIITNDSGKHAYEFHISYKGDNRHALRKRVSSLTPLSQRGAEVIPRYLSAEVSSFGYNRGPLHLDYHVSGHSRLLLFGRVANQEGPISTETWVQGRDMFFINCARRRMKRDGYIAMRRRRRRGVDEWITSCFPFRSRHNDHSVFMLFRLLPASYRKDPVLTSAEGGREFEDSVEAPSFPFDDHDRNPSLDEQLERYRRGTVPPAFRVPLSPLPKRMSSKTKPPPSPDSDDEDDRGDKHVRFDIGHVAELTVPGSGVRIPLLNGAGSTTQPAINAEDTTHL